MRVVIQRVSAAGVTISEEIFSSINKGLLILLGIEEHDSKEDVDWLCKKIGQLRIFSDQDGLMNLSLQEINGELLVVSQFTLYASTKKGNRPSFLRSARPHIAEPLYEYFIQEISLYCNKEVRKGLFGADMKIELINDGPVTILIDTKQKE